MTANIESVSLCVAALTMAGLAWYAWRNRDDALMRIFAVAMGSGVVWALEVAVELQIPNEQWKILLAGVRPLAHLGFFTGLTLLSVELSGAYPRFDRKHYAALLIVPAITLALSFGPDWHRLFRFHYRVAPYGSTTVAVSDKGPWNPILVGYEYLLVIVASVVLLRAALSAQAEFRRVTLAMAAGWGSVVVLSAVEQFGAIAGRWGASSYAVLAAASVTGWAVLRHKMLDLIPIARGVVIDQMNGLLFVLDARGKLVDCNRPAEEALGLPRRACLEKPLEGIPGPWAKVVGNAIGSAEPRGRVLVGEHPPARAYEWSVSQLRDRSGRNIGAACLFLDITERWRTEKALNESEERFRRMADTAPVILWFGGAGSRVTFFNRQAAVFTGRAPEQLTGDGWRDAVHTEDLARAMAVFGGGADPQDVVQGEFRLRRADGEYRWMLATTSPRFVGDVHAGRIGTCTDITDVKSRQEEDISRQKLESLGTLAGGIAHDFNNLLGGIHANAELALAEIEEKASPRDALRSIRTAAIRGAEVVRQLMTYSGQESAVAERADVSLLVADMVELLKASVSKNAIIETRLATDLPAVRAHPSQLSQVVMNLVINASEALGEKPGTIRVSTARATVHRVSSASAAEGVPDGEYVRIEVTDTGCGMTPAAKARIFEPFFTSKRAGRGLGLAVVQGIVRSLGGAVHAESAPGRGTTMRILLPCAAAAPKPCAGKGGVAEVKGPRGGKILIVEDESSLLLAAGKLLRKSGFSVFEAADGSAALAILRENRGEVDAMLLDVTLPGIPSTEVLREARRSLPDLKVILTSAYGEQQVADLFQGQAFDRFIRKPYLISDLATVLRETIASTTSAYAREA